MQMIVTTVDRGEEERVFDRDWTIVAACGICLMLSVGTLLLYSFGVFVRPLAAQFHWTRTQISGALTTGQFVVAVTCPLWGLLIDRFGPRKVILLSVVGMSLAYASLALLTPHVWHLYLGFALFTILGGAAAPLGYAAVLVRSFERHLGLALGFALMGIGVGASFLPKVATWLIVTHGWRTAYVVIGLATLAITVPSSLYATRYAKLPAAALTGKRVSIGSLVLTPTFLLMCSVFILLGTTSGGTLAHFVSMLIDRGLSPAEAATIAGAAGISVIGGRAGIGWLLDHFNPVRLLGGVALVIVAALLVLLTSQSKGSGYLASLLVGSVLGAEVDFTAYLVRRYFGNAAFGRLYGIAFGTFSTGVGMGPLLLGMSFDRFGSYRPGLILFVVLSLVAGVVTFALPAPSNAAERNVASDLAGNFQGS